MNKNHRLGMKLFRLIKVTTFKKIRHYASFALHLDDRALLAVHLVGPTSLTHDQPFDRQHSHRT
jgi:hypothetical protein